MTQQVSPQPRRRHRKDPGVDSANVVPDKRPRKKNVQYTPRNWFGCFVSSNMTCVWLLHCDRILLHCDGNLWIYYFSSLWNYVLMLVLKNWLGCQKLFVLATTGEALSFGNSWGGGGGWVSHVIPYGTTNAWVVPYSLARLSHATHLVWTESFGLVTPLRLARLLLPVTPYCLTWPGWNFLCELKAWCD
jgi:hypothetical protein